MITASIATPESDREIRERENAKGRWAKLEGKGRDTCPWVGGLCEYWWLEGYDSVSPHVDAK